MCFCNCACVDVYVSVSVFHFEGICVCVRQDVKQEKDTTPVEETKRQKVWVGQERGRKGIKTK